MKAVRSSLTRLTIRPLTLFYDRVGKRGHTSSARHILSRSRTDSSRRPFHLDSLPDDSSSTGTSLVATPKLKCILLEIDGLLQTVSELYTKAVTDIFAEKHDVQLQSDESISLWKTDTKSSLAELAERHGVLSFDVDMTEEELRQIFIQRLTNAEIDNSDLTKIVQTCLSTEQSLVLLSSLSREKISSYLTAIGIDCRQSIQWDKSTAAGRINKERLHEQGLEPDNCVFVATTLHGAKSASALGISCVGLAVQEDDESTWANAGVTVVYRSATAINTASLKEAFYTSSRKQIGPVEQDQSWLQGEVPLPGGWRTNRRGVLQTVNLGAAVFCLYILSSRSQALSLISPKSFVNALNPFQRRSNIVQGDINRVDAFKRYIADVEGRGGGQVVSNFPRGADWFNAPPLSLDRELNGKMVVLDFWTYCCINCMHVVPDLAYIENRFANEPVAVVGVHSAKFDNEKDSQAIRNAVLRYNINHPVINDTGMAMWRDLGVSSWPTLAILSPKGQLLFALTGEGHRQDLDDLITAGLEYYGPRQLLDRKAIPLALEKLKDDRLLGSNLRYPSKVASDISGDRLFISDSNNNRIVVTTLFGDFVEQIGGNGAKLVDGSYIDCCFNRPQGLCYDSKRDALYVADTENHALREINLANKTVRTLAGNGYQGRDYKGGAGGKLQQLNSPWDVEIGTSASELFIALAGQHQIWRYDLLKQVAETFSGNGAESNKNGDNARSTSWSQPSGLTALPGDQQTLVVADSESSSIRKLDLRSGGSESIAGGDPLFAENLFRYGDKDGKFTQVLLQHPLGVLAVDDSKIYIADSYNHKIKLCDLQTSTVKTIAGSGSAGYADGKEQKSMMSEPSGLALGPNNTLFIADTNNNLIRVLDIQSETLSTLEVKNVPKPRISPLDDDTTFDVGAPAKVVVSDEMSTMFGRIQVNVQFPKGYGFTKGATSSFVTRVVDLDNDTIQIEPDRGVIAVNRSPNFELAYTSSENSLTNMAKIQIDCKVYYCEEGKECLFEDIRFEIPLSKQLKSGTSSLELALRPIASA